MGDVAKLGLPLQHSAQTSELLKIGSHSYSDMKFFIQVSILLLFLLSLVLSRIPNSYITMYKTLLIS